jgi:hypothetical protein
LEKVLECLTRSGSSLSLLRDVADALLCVVDAVEEDDDDE